VDRVVCTNRLFDRSQAITALTVAERRETGPRRRRSDDGRAPRGVALVTDRLIRMTTALAVIAVASVAAIIS
jgi:hypothetical protein